MLLNRQNFLRWDDGQSPSTVEGDIAEGYLQDRNRCNYRPLLAASEALRFYINVPEGLSFIEAPNVHLLALVKKDGTVADSDIATLQVHEFAVDGGTAKTFYAEVIIDGTVAPGVYFFQIKKGSDVALTSNEIHVVPAGTAHREYSSLVKFRHDRYFYGINYHDVSTFYQQFRLHINKLGSENDNDREVYTEVTTGKQRVYNNSMKRIVKVETYYFDKYAHEAAGVMFEHDEVFINLKKYTAKGVYKETTNPRSKIFKGEIELYDEEFASINRCSG